MKKCVSMFLFLLCTVYFAGGYYTSVDFDAGVCAGGFDKHLVDTEIDSIEKAVNKSLTENQTMNLMSNFIFIGRKIYTYYKDDNNTVYLVGKKVWYDEYKWKKAEIK